MQTSDSISKIAPALLSAQREITFAVKDSINPHYKSKYADLGAVIDAAKPALNKHGISFIQMPAPSDPGTLALSTRLMHESGEWIESLATVPLSKNDPQGYGSAITYLRRYSLAAAVGLYQDDDDGNAASAKPRETTSVSDRPQDYDAPVYDPLGSFAPHWRRTIRKAVQDAIDHHNKGDDTAAYEDVSTTWDKYAKNEDGTYDEDKRNMVKQAIAVILKDNASLRNAFKAVMQAEKSARKEVVPA